MTHYSRRNHYWVTHVFTLHIIGAHYSLHDHYTWVTVSQAHTFKHVVFLLTFLPSFKRIITFRRGKTIFRNLLAKVVQRVSKVLLSCIKSRPMFTIDSIDNFHYFHWYIVQMFLQALFLKLQKLRNMGSTLKLQSGWTFTIRTIFIVRIDHHDGDLQCKSHF